MNTEEKAQKSAGAKDGHTALRYLLTLGELYSIVGGDEDTLRNAFRQHEIIERGGRKSGIQPAAVKRYLSQRGVDYSFRIISHINLRGGIGKTTATATCATRALQYGFKVCILDLDPQGSSSLLFEKIPMDGEPIFYDIWKNPEKMVKHAIKNIENGLSIIPSSLENALLDISLSNPAAQKNAVKDVCTQLRMAGYDLILVDCPPSLGVAVIAAICASDIVAIPMCEDVFSLKGLELTLDEINSICETFNLSKPQIKILYSKYDRRVKITMDVFTYLSEHYRSELITAPIRTSTDFIKALSRRETVFAGHKTSTARDDYDQYVRQLLGITIQGKEREGGK